MTNSPAVVLVTSNSDTGSLQLLNGGAIAVGSDSWLAWLKVNTGFRFESGLDGSTSFTARKHERDSGDFWYAYRKIGGKLRNAYLGKSEALTVTRLLDAANKLVMHELGKGITVERTDKVAVLPNLLHNSTDLEQLKAQLADTIFHRDHFARELAEAREKAKQLEAELELVRSNAGYAIGTMNNALEQEQLAKAELATVTADRDHLDQELSQLQGRSGDLALELANLKEQLVSLQDANNYSPKLAIAPDSPGIAVLVEAMKLRANSGGAIKAEIRKAIALFNGEVA